MCVCALHTCLVVFHLMHVTQVHFINRIVCLFINCSQHMDEYIVMYMYPGCIMIKQRNTCCVCDETTKHE